MIKNRTNDWRWRDIVSKIYGFLTAERRFIVLACIVAAAAALFALLMLGWGFVSGAGDYWLRPLYDAGAHLSGWLFYKADSWRFPIFETLRMDYPDGVSIAMTDSIPIVAAIMKLVGGGVAGNWHFFGVFVVVSYALNGMALVWLLRQMGVTNMLGAMFAFVFACFTTLYCIQFESFAAHFFVIFSLGFYFRLLSKFDSKSMGMLLAIVLLSPLVHPYLFVMCGAILAVTVATLWSRKTLPWKESLMWLGGMILGSGLVYMLCGYGTHPSTGFQDKLFGLSPTLALDVTALFRKEYLVSEIGVYLGLGFWALVILAVWLAWRAKPKFVRQHIFLIAMCVAFLLFAISNTVFLGGKTMLHIELPGFIQSAFELFRTSKRFIVPLYYLVATVAFVFALKHKSKRVVLIIILALLVQVADVAYFVQGTYVAARTGQEQLIDTNRIRSEYANIDNVAVFPSYSCMFNYRLAPMRPNQWTASQELYEVAAQEGKISNSVRASRRTKDCDLESLTGHLAPPKGSIYFYIKDDNNAALVEPSPECLAAQQEFEYGVYCKGQ
jgi:hypothetical protein